MSEEHPPFTTWLKRRRRGLDLTQEELAAEVGCALTTLQKIERGERRPSKQIAECLAVVLGIPPAEQPAFIAYARAILPDEVENASAAAPAQAPSSPWQPTPAAHGPPAPQPRRHNLPLQLTSFIGRDREIAEITRLLDQVRLVTLTGAGGSGKTRLALRVAEGLQHGYPDGVWWADLARLADAEALPQAIAAGLGLRPEGQRPLFDQVSDYLQRRRLLLLLDNCEHLIAACAGLAESFLRAAPGVTILATSREPLAIAGETLYVVPTLEVPGDGRLPPLTELVEVESVRLFSDRATAARAGFAISEDNAAPVAEICRRLDGIPLAIELAAARVRELEVDELCRRLDDRFQVLTGGSRTGLPRHRTLRATLEWSYGLLAEDERVLLRRLAVFAGGWDLEAAEAVCAGDDLGGETMDLLFRLVDKSLVVLGWRGHAGRYGMLETMREYALERLRESGEEDRLWQAHAGYFLALAERAEPLLFTPEQTKWLDRLEEEHANLRAAYATLRGQDDPAPALRLAGALERFWEVHCDFAEGQAWLNEMLAAAGDAAEPAVRAKALLAAGMFNYFRRDHATAGVQLAASLELYRALGNRQRTARVLLYLAWLAQDRSQFDEARALAEESAAICQETGDKLGLGWALSRLGATSYWAGDLAAARLLLEQGLALCREVDDKYGLVEWLMMLTATLLGLGEYSQTVETAKEGVLRCRELGARRNLSSYLYVGGAALVLSGDALAARPWMGEALLTARDVGEQMMLAQALACYGMLCLAEGRPATTLRLGGASEVISEAGGFGTPKPGRVMLDRIMSAARQAIGPEAAQAAWIQGRTMALDELIAEALGEEAASVR